MSWTWWGYPRAARTVALLHEALKHRATGPAYKLLNPFVSAASGSRFVETAFAGRLLKSGIPHGLMLRHGGRSSGTDMHRFSHGWPPTWLFVRQEVHERKRKAPRWKKIEHLIKINTRAIKKRLNHHTRCEFRSNRGGSLPRVRSSPESPGLSPCTVFQVLSLYRSECLLPHWLETDGHGARCKAC